MKSRFSHKQIHLFYDYSFDDYAKIFANFLTLPEDFEDKVFKVKWEKHLKVRQHISEMSDDDGKCRN